MKWPMVTWRYAAIVRSTAGSHNGVACLRNCARAVVASCLFWNCSHRSSENSAAACVLVYENPTDSGIADTNFVSCRADRSFLVTVTSGTNLTLVDCWFSGSREAELNLQLLVLDGCMFEQEEFPVIQFENVRRVRAPVATGRPEAVVAAAAAIAAVLAVAATGAVLLARRRLCDVKYPRAIQ
jgi:hypothetical protein